MINQRIINKNILYSARVLTTYFKHKKLKTQVIVAVYCKSKAAHQDILHEIKSIKNIKTVVEDLDEKTFKVHFIAKKREVPIEVSLDKLNFFCLTFLVFSLPCLLVLVCFGVFLVLLQMD